ncbi:site-2 protease family protein [Geodermatophilus sp. SYSU D00697]
MGGTVAVGRIAGVAVKAHWSVLVIAGLLAWSMSTRAFPDAAPGSSPLAYWIAGTAAAAVFLLGLLAHELSHAIVARRHGVAVDDITLWLFGGVARLRGEAPDPRAELRIAGVGPLVSLLLGVGFGVLAIGLAAIGVAGLPLVTLSWLAGINVLLAVFNVLPGAPLDGGRLLRAALWRWRGDRLWATVAASRAGRALGLVLIGLGLWEFLAYRAAAGVWLALIGWFILGAAGAEQQQAQLTSELAGVRVRDVMTPQPDTAPLALGVAAFIDGWLLQRRHSTFPLLDSSGRPAGLVTAARVKAVPPARRATTALSEVALPMADVPVATPDEPLADLLPRLSRRTDGRTLVVDDGHLVGIVSPVDITWAVERAAVRGRPSVATPGPRDP